MNLESNRPGLVKSVEVKIQERAQACQSIIEADTLHIAELKKEIEELQRNQ